MSAVVCGKRSSSIFADELLPPSPPSPNSSHHHHHHHHQAKRSRFSPHRGFDGAHRREALLHQLRVFFPDMDPQLLERALEASGDDLDSAIKSLKELHLESTQAILSATGWKSENGLPTAVLPCVEGIPTNAGVDTATEHPPAPDSHQTTNSGPEWVELFVREMTNASDMDDARARASRALEALKKSIVERAGAEAAQSLHQENIMLKEQLTAVLSQNAVLKRAVTIQHERQKEFDERSHEVQSLKQLVLQYQEQMRTLELLQGYFRASGNILDAAIRGFKDYLASGSTEPGSVMTNADIVSSEVTSDVPALNIPTNGSEWAELVVKEMSSASDLTDAKNRACKILELFEKCTANCNIPDEKQKMREEHKILKQMLGGLLHQNGILKRAFLIQHNRLKDYQDMVQERSQFKEIVDKYQERIKALEDKNYILSFHLEQSKQQNIISGHYNPDVF